MKNISKIRVAIFDLTDCEGCELQFLALREKLVKSGHDFEITNWRLANESNSEGPFDVTFIEGTPITQTDIEILKQARKMSKTVVTLGACADIGGVQSALPASARKKNLAEVYDAKYKTDSVQPRPISYYIDVDVHLPGCPVNEKELERLLGSLFFGKKFTPRNYPVCLDCKANSAACLFLDEGFCLGPVTTGGCGAPCPKRGLRCFGCFGVLPSANISALKPASKHITDKEIDNALNLFFSGSDEYKAYKLNFKEKPKKKKK